MHELPLDRKKLEKLADKASHYNVFPIFLPRYLKEKHPVTPLLVELVAEAREFLSVLSVDEVQSTIDALPPGARVMIDWDPVSDSELSRARVAVYCVAAAVDSLRLSFHSVVKEDLDNSEVLRVYPELRDRLDKDGLLAVGDDVVLHDGGVEYHDHMLHYHQLLRRGYTSNPNFDFLTRLSQYHQQTAGTNSFGVAIDHRRIMLKQWYEQMFERDYWHGPPFDPSRLDDPTAVGLTVMARNKNSLFHEVNRLERTEFLWSCRDGIKTLEVEEVSSSDYQFETYHFNRYVHSERNTEAQVTRHLDGAVKVYQTSAYQDRLGTKLPNEPKCSRKIKLWRIDGDIDLENWIELMCLFYKSNEMLIEYFNPAAFEEMFELRVRDFKEWKRQQEAGAGET